VWRAVALGGVAGALGVAFLLRPSVASASELHRLAAAARAQQTRHTLDLRPDAQGKMILCNEFWMEGEKHAEIYYDADGGVTLAGYNGRRMYLYRTKDGGFIDDVEPDRAPIETIEDYLKIPGGTLANVEKGVNLEGRDVDVYRLNFGNMGFDLFIDPASGLPIRRDVFTTRGKLIERNLYDYPADIPDKRFNPPADRNIAWTDYPAIRTELSRKLRGPGETKTLGGVKITLRAVIVGNRQLVALWTGGAKTEYHKDGHIRVEGLPDGLATGLATMSVWPSNDPDKRPLYLNGQQLLGDSAWYRSSLKLKAPFTISVPVWAEDRTRPLVSSEGQKLPGFHSKFLGSLTFRVNSAIYAEGPERVLWRPGDEVVKTATAADAK